MPPLAAPVVLMYHSISAPRGEADLWGLQVHPERFRRQIRTLASEHDIVGLDTLAHDVRMGRLRPHRVALTFDDGYANNLDVAGPILREFRAPATIFVCTGFTGRRAFWWDQLADTIFTATRRPRGALGPALGVSDREMLTGGLGLDPAPAARRQLVMDIWQVLRSWELDRIVLALAALEELFRPAGQLDDLRPMTADEIETAAAGFAIGAHSVTHPRMSALSDEALTAEIADSIRTCERTTGRSVEAFAYPFGDVDARVSSEVARRVGLACSTQEAPIGPKTDLHQIPRIQVCDWPPEQLISRMHDVVAAS